MDYSNDSLLGIKKDLNNQFLYVHLGLIMENRKPVIWKKNRGGLGFPNKAIV